ncbi:MAG: (2Fe-2S)-binding protein [Bacteroidales bacterium]|nr:(2Fe-2S)-binding protein [Bacteroidales bacterium]
MHSCEPAPACTGSCRSCPSVGSCPDRIVCRCLQVTEQEIITAIQIHGATTERAVQQLTEAGSGCGCCRREIRQYLAVYALPVVQVEMASV